MSEAPFPSLVITKDALLPQGSFAEAQAEYLEPDPALVEELTELLSSKKIGVVAHFYMDPELQGVLSASSWPHIQISDSLAMADRAIAMAEAGVKAVVVLGVDFMSENVRAMLDAQGHEEVPVYRVATKEIGCSLASSAEALAYGAFLTRASKTERSLHVVYINTSLRTKARAHALVPTITCTSSNVVRTVLTAFAQVPDLHLWYGPDTYMGRNLEVLFRAMSEMDEEAIRAIHPEHDKESIRSLLERFDYFRQGVCVVHHMFGEAVARRVEEDYADAYVTAHLEVPGEMFEIGMKAQREGRGVVGSTSNILEFIASKIEAAIAKEEGEGERERLRFVLGTEAGMITSIVRRVQGMLRESGAEVEAEIIFPVAAEAIAESEDPELAVVPGVAAGEGCSVAGGCATCPYMKMNSLEALFAVAREVGVQEDAALAGFHPHKYTERIDGRTAADLGGEPILHMRAFQQERRLPAALVADILER